MAVTVVTVPDEFSYSKNAIPIKLHTNLSLVDDIRIDVTISIVDGSTTTTLVFSETPDSSGNVYMDFSGLLDEYMDHNWNMPVPAGTGRATLSKSPIRIGLLYEEFKNNVSQSTGAFASNKYVLQGGLNYKEKSLKGINPILTSLLSHGPLFPFLTWRKNRVIDKTMQDFLYFFNPAYTFTGKIELKIYNDAGLQSTTYIAVSVPNSVITLLYTGYTALGIPALVADATSYTVQLCAHSGISTNEVSEVITYYLDPKYYKTKTYLAYENSLNGFESVRFTGDADSKGDYERTSAQVTDNNHLTDFSNSILATPEGGLNRTSVAREQYANKVNSGYLSDGEINSLREMLVSARIFEVRADTWLPVQLTEKTKELIKSGNFLNGMAVEYQYLWRDRVWTPELS